MMSIYNIAKHSTAVIIGGMTTHKACQWMMQDAYFDPDYENHILNVVVTDTAPVIAGAGAAVATEIAFDAARDKIKKTIKNAKLIHN